MKGEKTSGGENSGKAVRRSGSLIVVICGLQVPCV